MKTKFYLYVVTIICVLLLVLNITLNNTLDKVQQKNINLIDQYLDISEQYSECEMDYIIVLDEVTRLEHENQILGSMVDEKTINQK